MMPLKKSHQLSFQRERRGLKALSTDSIHLEKLMKCKKNRKFDRNFSVRISGRIYLTTSYGTIKGKYEYYNYCFKVLI